MLQFNIQLFADETGSISVDSAPAFGSDAPAVDGTAVQDSAVDFDGILSSNPAFKAEYDKRMNKAVTGRHNDYKALKERDTASDSAWEFVAKHYGIAPGEDGKYDRKAVEQAMLDDDSALEEEALERNMTVSQLKALKAIERDNAVLRQQAAERQAEDEERAFFADLVKQGEALKQTFPNLDLQVEMNNKAFVDNLTKGLSVEQAYKLAHMDEIVGGSIQYAVKRTAERVSNSVQANRSRPRENGTSSNLPSSADFNPALLSKTDRKTLRERVYRGERITF